MDPENFTFTPELMAEIHAGTKTAADIPIERQAEFREILQDPSKLTPAVPDAAAEAAVVETPAVETPAAPQTPAAAPEVVEDETAVLEASVTSTRTQIESEVAAQKKFDEANAELEAIIAKPLPDRFHDDYEDAVAARNEALQKQNQLLIKQRLEDRQRDLEDKKRHVETQAEALVSKQIERVGTEYPELKTEIPYSQMKAQYGAYAEKLVRANGGTSAVGTPEFDTELNAAYKRLKEDGEFAAKPEVAPPAWLDKFSILRTAELRAAKTGMSLKASIASVVVDFGQDDKWLKRTAVVDPAQAARDNTAALDRRNLEPKTADVNSGSANKGVSNIPVKGDKEACRRYLTIYNDKLQKMAPISDEDRLMATNAREWIQLPD